MAVTSPSSRPGPPPPARPGVAAGAAAQQAAAAAAAMRAAITARRRTIGASLGALPVANVVVIEVGLAIGLILLAIDVKKMLYVAIGVVGLALLIAFLR